MAPPNPWTGSGSNIALRTLLPLNTLLAQLSELKASELDKNTVASHKRKILNDFNNSVKPLHREAVLRGLLASRVFNRANKIEPIAHTSQQANEDINKNAVNHIAA